MAAIEISVGTNAAQIAAALGDFVGKQLPFATATALTRVAQDSREEVVRAMPQHFKIRSKRVLKTVRIQPADKRDWPHPQAKVGILDQFMAIHVLGGQKTPQKGAAHIAVPTSLVRRRPSGSILPGYKPRALRDRPDVFTTPVSIVKRLERARGPLKNLGGVGRFFSLVTSATIQATWPMPREVERTAGATYEQHFRRELEAAVRSARVRAGHFTSEQGRAAYLAKRVALGRIGG